MIMESGNSSSMQSSSGGDDQEMESSGGGGGVIGGSSANYFTTSNINNNTTTTQPYNNNPSMFMLSSAQQLPVLTPPLSLQHQHQASYLDVFQNQASYQNLMFWQQQQQQQFGGNGSGSGSGGGGGSGVGLSDHPSINNPSCTVNTTHLSALGNSPRPSTSQHTGGGGGASSSGGVGAGATGGVGKNTRKRTRASRRAPTTVLTTDTSNFRAMVQEFTGIPSSPFSAAASPLLSRRLTDLLSGTSSSPGPNLRPGPPPPLVGPSTSTLERLFSGYNTGFPLRPSAHKLNSTSTDNTQQNIHATSNTSNTFSPLGNLSIQSLLQPSATPSSLRYPPSVASAAGLLTPSVGNFQDLSGVIGSESVFGFAPMRLAPDSGEWRGGSSGGGGGVTSNEEGGDHDEGNNNNNNIGIDSYNNDNNDNNNQQMEGSISGSGTSNYNVNMNCSRDKGLDSNTSNRGGAQGTLGDFLG